MTMEVVWHEPPARATGKYGKRFAEFVDILKTRPGEWAEIPLMEPAGYSSSIKQNVFKHHPNVEWQTRPVGDNYNRVRVWGRYVEPEAETDAETNGIVLRSVGRMERVDALARKGKNDKQNAQSRQ